MSQFNGESQPFPSEKAVHEAYLALMGANQYAAPDDRKQIEELRRSLGSLSLSTLEMLDELADQPIAEAISGARQEVAKLDRRFGRTFNFMGLQVECGNQPMVIAGIEMELTHPNLIVPEIDDPELYAGYLEHLGYRGVYGQPLSYALAQDVLDTLYHRVNDLEDMGNEVAVFYPGSHPEANQVLRPMLDIHMDQFRAIMPFYYNARFGDTESYRHLENRVIAETT